MCERWRKFDNFLADMGEPPPGFTIERKDNSKGYSLENCEWIPHARQAQNKRNNWRPSFVHPIPTLCPNRAH